MMLEAHLSAVEETLRASSGVGANTGHTLHKGTPREVFVREFLEAHLSANVAIGTGEIIDSNSKPGDSRNQYDIVIYKNNYPKLDFKAGISGFLIESVIATIEVKSILDQKAIEQSVVAANNAKILNPSITKNFSSGWVPPKVLNYVFAYKGPATMETAYKWILKTHKDKKIELPSWNVETRTQTPGTALDGVFVLDGGFVKLDNTPISFTPEEFQSEVTFSVSDNKRNNLLLFFFELQEACNNVQGAWLNAYPYIKNISFDGVRGC